MTLGLFLHSVKVGNTLSHHTALQYGVPQGSVLGPILFPFHTNPISSIIHSHSSINYHFYDDDTLLHVTLPPANFSLSPKNHKQLLFHFPINILGNQVSPAQSVRNLGMVFHSNFKFSNYVSQVIKSTRVYVRDLYKIRPLLDLKSSVLLANALLSSRLDNCNSMFLSLTDFELRRLQLVQNSLCRVVTHSSKFSNITPHYMQNSQPRSTSLPKKINSPYTSFRKTRRCTPKLKFLQTPTFDHRVHKSNTLLILSVTMPQFFGTVSPFKFETVPLSHLLGNTSKPTSSAPVSKLILLPSWSHPHFWITDPECPSTLPMIMILFN